MSNGVNDFNSLSRQGNQRVRIKKVYHVMKNRDVPSHHEFEHRSTHEYCPECAALGNQYTPPVSLTPIQYVSPSPRQAQIYHSPMQFTPPPAFAARVPLPEAPALQVYTPPTGFDMPINRNHASYTPNTVIYEPESYTNNNNNPDVNFYFLYF
jgi:hypothetical protein